MRIRNLGAAVVLIVAALGLSACAESLNTQVSRYQAMPAPQGQSFAVVPVGAMATTGGLEFQRYAAIVAQQLQARGYQPASDAKSANMIVQLGYSLDHGQVRVQEDPFYRSGFGYGGFGYGGFGYSPFYYPRFGRYGFGSPFYYGWDDPFLYGGGGIDSWVEYHSEVDLYIRQAGTGQPLFDGRAQARSATNRLDVLVPNLVEALFTGFPGQNGETVKITIPVRPRA
jgi:hypothetical protein